MYTVYSAKCVWENKAFLGDILPILIGFGGENFALKGGGAYVGQLGHRQNKDFVAEYTPMAQARPKKINKTKTVS